MRKAILLYNPLSGRRCERRRADVGKRCQSYKAPGLKLQPPPPAPRQMRLIKPNTP